MSSIILEPTEGQPTHLWEDLMPFKSLDYGDEVEIETPEACFIGKVTGSINGEFAIPHDVDYRVWVPGIYSGIAGVTIYITKIHNQQTASTLKVGDTYSLDNWKAVKSISTEEDREVRAKYRSYISPICPLPLTDFNVGDEVEYDGKTHIVSQVNYSSCRSAITYNIFQLEENNICPIEGVWSELLSAVKYGNETYWLKDKSKMVFDNIDEEITFYVKKNMFEQVLENNIVTYYQPSIAVHEIVKCNADWFEETPCGDVCLFKLKPIRDLEGGYDFPIRLRQIAITALLKKANNYNDDVIPLGSKEEIE